MIEISIRHPQEPVRWRRSPILTRFAKIPTAEGGGKKLSYEVNFRQL